MSQQPLINIENLHVSVQGKPILKGLNLVMMPGEIHAIMGPNGSGKSTLASTLMGHPSFEITDGSVSFRGQDLLAMSVDERAKAGVFLAFQYPVAIPGVSVASFLRTAIKSLRGADMSARDFRASLKKEFKHLTMDEKFATRYVNDGFSGGEKKRLEIAQLGMIKPHLAILDETDSGLDIDALKIVAENVMRNFNESGEMSLLVITHYQRLLRYIPPQVVHVLADGRIIKNGDKELAHELETRGYDWVLAEAGVQQEVK
ncbi:MAG: Fe-S cluster assembly ATPase SufC [Armatimonadota bacterium]